MPNNQNPKADCTASVSCRVDVKAAPPKSTSVKAQKRAIRSLERLQKMMAAITQ